LKFAVEEKKGFGILDVINTGYNAINTREILGQYNEDEYLDSMEENVEGDFSITSY